jgi:DNA-binding transcriptional LysR family regulator
MRDFNDLFFFAAVVKNKGFSAAARQLGVPKSRISRRVAEFEAQLGVRLIERSTRSLHITEVGRSVYRHARAAVDMAESIEGIALQMRSEPQGLVRISCPLGIQRTISTALPAFLDRHPLLRVQLLITNRPVDLISEGVDVAVRVRERLDASCELPIRRIGASRRILVASKTLLTRLGWPEAPAALERFPTLHAFEQSGPVTWTLSGPGEAEATVETEPRLSAGEFAVLLDAAINGIGVALLPEIECLDAFENKQLERVLPQWSVADGLVHLVFTSRRGMLPSVRAVIDFLAGTLKSIVSPSDV